MYSLIFSVKKVNVSAAVVVIRGENKRKCFVVPFAVVVICALKVNENRLKFEILKAS